MAGVEAFGAYLPRRRLSREAIAAAHSWHDPATPARAKGVRTMASWDEDAITMAVEAARRSMIGLDRAGITHLSLASTTLPFADRSNAGVLAGALALSEAVSTADFSGSQRAGLNALQAALSAADGGGRTLVLASDRRLARPMSAEEARYGDAAAGVLVSRGDGVARYLGGASRTVDFVGHYRETGEAFDYHWEERWIRDEGYKAIVPDVVKRALEASGVGPDEVAHFVLPAPSGGIAEQIAALCGLPREAVRPSLNEAVGDSGCAHGMLMLCHVLEAAAEGEVIVLAGFGQGATVLVFRATSALRTTPRTSLATQLESGVREASYMKYLVFNDLVDWQKDKRAERDKPTALTTQFRKREMLGSLTGGECEACGTRQFPPTRICVNPKCAGVDTQRPHVFADEIATVVSFSADRLAFTPDPPLIYGIVAFEGGGRLMMEFADCEASEIAIGTRLTPAFRIKDRDARRGFRRYFWKAAPVRFQEQV